LGAIRSGLVGYAVYNETWQQWLLIHNPKVGGSIPSPATNLPILQKPSSTAYAAICSRVSDLSPLRRKAASEDQPNVSLGDMTPREFLLTQNPEFSTYGWS